MADSRTNYCTPLKMRTTPATLALPAFLFFLSQARQQSAQRRFCVKKPARHPSKNQLILKRNRCARKYAKHGCAAVTHWLCYTYWPDKTNCAIRKARETAFSAPEAALFALRKGYFRLLIWPISHCDMGHFALRYGPFCKTAGPQGLTEARFQALQSLFQRLGSC